MTPFTLDYYLLSLCVSIYNNYMLLFDPPCFIEAYNTREAISVCVPLQQRPS